MQTGNSNSRSSISYGRVFRNRSFVALWLGQMISFIGDYFNWIAVPIMVERLTGSALMVGLAVISNALPTLLLGPVAGVFVDRWDRKRTMIAADLLRAVLILPCLLVQTADQVWIYYVSGFLMSCVSRFFFPSQSALLPIIVPDEDDLLAANGLMQIIQTLGLLVGGGLAGFAIGLWGPQFAFIADSITFALSAVVIMTMTVPRTTQGQQATGGKIAAVLAEMREGVTYLFGNRTMVGVLLCLGVTQFGVGALQVVWIPFLQRTFGVGAEGVGIVDSVQGGGMILGGLILGYLSARMNQITMVGWSLAIVGLSLFGMGAASGFAYVVVCSFVLGVALMPMQSVLNTMMQLAVPDLKRGRVGSALNALTTAAGMLSMAGASAFADQIGLRTIFITCGLVISGGGLLGLFVLKEPQVQSVTSET